MLKKICVFSFLLFSLLNITIKMYASDDVIPPVIEGVKNITLKVKEEPTEEDQYSEEWFDVYEGITAYDNIDGDLTMNLWFEGYYDEYRPGVYEVSFSVNDSNGNTTVEDFTITVEEKANTYELVGKTTTVVAGVGTAAVILAKLSVFDKLLMLLSKFDWFSKLQAFFLKKMKRKGFYKLKQKLFKRKKQLITKYAPETTDPFSQGIKIDKMVFVSGQLPLNPINNELKEGAFDQTEQVMKNIDQILKKAKFSMDDIVKTRIYLSSMEDFQEVNKAYSIVFLAPYPARSTVEVHNLPKGVKVKIEAIAYKK